MYSFTTQRTLYGNLSNDASAVNLTLGDILMNDSLRQILSGRRWKFLEKTKTLSTVASQQAYVLPSDFLWLDGLRVTIGTTVYRPIEIHSREQWDRINMFSGTSDIPQYFFIFNGSLQLFPTPASSTANAITFVYVRRQKDLSVADYTTGNILTATNGSAAIVGTGTTFTAAMVGRWLRITDSDTANKGDGEWYQIASYTSATAITLETLYNGTSISSGTAAYAIGQVSLLPEAFQALPVYKALVHYFTSVKPDQLKSKLYNDMYVNLFSDMEASEAGKSNNNVLNRGIYYAPMENPNNFPGVIS